MPLHGAGLARGNFPVSLYSQCWTLHASGPILRGINYARLRTLCSMSRVVSNIIHQCGGPSDVVGLVSEVRMYHMVCGLMRMRKVNPSLHIFGAVQHSPWGVAPYVYVAAVVIDVGLMSSGFAQVLSPLQSANFIVQSYPWGPGEAPLLMLLCCPIAAMFLLYLRLRIVPCLDQPNTIYLRN